MKKRQDPLTDHHILPRSRGGQKENNIKRVPNSYHEAYHKLFANMTHDEIGEYMEQMWFSNGQFIPPERWLRSLAVL
jgi:hypothetical protein